MILSADYKKKNDAHGQVLCFRLQQNCSIGVTNFKIYLFLLSRTIAANVKDAKFVATGFARTNIISL